MSGCRTITIRLLWFVMLGPPAAEEDAYGAYSELDHGLCQKQGSSPK